MAVTDDERREAARRLRGRQGAVCQDDDSPELTKWEDLAAIVLLPEQFRACMRFKNRDNRTQAIRSVIAGRLADLIESSCDRDTPQKVAEEMFGKMRHSTKGEADAYDAMLKSKSIEVHPVDRDALLELADEMDEVAQSRWQAGHKAIAINDADRAARIREALGVSDGSARRTPSAARKSPAASARRAGVPDERTTNATTC